MYARVVTNQIQPGMWESEAAFAVSESSGHYQAQIAKLGAVLAGGRAWRNCSQQARAAREAGELKSRG